MAVGREREGVERKAKDLRIRAGIFKIGRGGYRQNDVQTDEFTDRHTE